MVGKGFSTVLDPPGEKAAPLLKSTRSIANEAVESSLYTHTTKSVTNSVTRAT